MNNQTTSARKPRFRRNVLLIEFAIILIVAILYGNSLLNPDPTSLQQTGEHNEASTLAILTAVSLNRYGEIPLWNPFAMTGFPHSGDPLTEVFNPIQMLSYIALGPVRGLRASVLIALFLAGVGQLLLGYVLGFKFTVRL